MITIEQKLEKLQKQIEQIQKQVEATTEPLTRVHLFMKKIDLIKIQNKLQKPKINYEKVIDQLEYDLKMRMIK